MIDVRSFDRLVFAGGGNRCFWQAGVLARWAELGHRLPADLYGTSAGASIAASALTIGPRAALDHCRRLFAANERMVDWHDLARARLRFAHQTTYPDWVAQIVNADTFTRLREAPQRLWVSVARPATLLGQRGSVVAATLAYLIDKKVSHSIHPRLPRFLGLRQQFFALGTSPSVAHAQAVLNAAAGAPPITPSIHLGGAWAFDGGYVDNAPVPAQAPDERQRTLVLLTRHYPDRPATFVHQGRQYWQPSRKVPVSTWNCTHRATVDDAWALGQEDARRVLG
ncbi:patatin-like phospholipase family protein [Pseudaquabacterium rugosum]|uniref:Patatin-like phospholipase family protein n=1 Tax=Pseudaquabacterium rugosum TaxID=2984194 RepID=A0ABU9BJZ5_9BURK